MCDHSFARSHPAPSAGVRRIQLAGCHTCPGQGDRTKQRANQIERIQQTRETDFHPLNVTGASPPPLNHFNELYMKTTTDPKHFNILKVTHHRRKVDLVTEHHQPLASTKRGHGLQNHTPRGSHVLAVLLEGLSFHRDRKGRMSLKCLTYCYIL